MHSDPFALFCLYYLGLSEAGEYRFTNGNKVAKLLNWSVAQLMRELQRQGLHPDQVLNTDFPLAQHQVEIQLAADEETGPQLLERAQQIYQAFRQRIGKRRDWLKEIEEEQQQDRSGTDA